MRRIWMNASGPTHPWPKFGPSLRRPRQRARPHASSLGHPGPPASDPRNSWPIPLAKALCRPSPPSSPPRQPAPSYQLGPQKLPPHLATDKPRQLGAPPAPTASSGAHARCSGHIATHCPITYLTLCPRRYVRRSSQLPA
jgi:hypothetical protein